MSSGDVALFVDWDNLQLPATSDRLEKLKDFAKSSGRLVLARAYYDWAAAPDVQFDLYAAGIEPVYVPCRRSDGQTIKNSVDVKMSVDCANLTNLCPSIQTVVLVSCDVDFIHITQSLRQRGIRVIVAGRPEGSSKRLTASCDEVVHYDTKPAMIPIPPGKEIKKPCLYKASTVEKVVTDILRELKAEGKRGYPQSIGGLKNLLLKRLPHFDEKAYGSNKFSDYIKAREAEGVLKVVRKGTIDHVSLP